MSIMVNGWAKPIAAVLIGILGCVITTGSSDASRATNQYIVKPLAQTFERPFAFRPTNVPASNQSFVLVPQILDMTAFHEPFRATNPNRPPFVRHKVEARFIAIGRTPHFEGGALRSDAHLVAVGGSLKDDDRLRQPGEGTREGGVTVLRPASPKV
ncbi:MAG TPA: hypothetical protein VEJ16_03855 [Alphaproteobacteria bacterium]|nr:hypothetical protein [Alphaproteobacteria bacterium]